MILNPETRVAGFTERQIRDACKQASVGEGFWRSWLEKKLTAASAEQVDRIIQWLVERGYAEEGKDGWWKFTGEGKRFRNAKVKGISRAIADRALQRYLTTITSVNDNPTLRWRIAEIVVYGSYLTEKEVLSDVDVCVRCELKTQPRTYSRQALLRMCSAVNARPPMDVAPAFGRGDMSWEIATGGPYRQVYQYQAKGEEEGKKMATNYEARRLR